MDLLGRVPQKTLAKAPNISVHVTLDSPNVNFNFAALAEDKYGWDALHPVAARLRAINKYESDEESDSEAQALGDDSAANERQVPALWFLSSPEFCRLIRINSL